MKFQLHLLPLVLFSCNPSPKSDDSQVAPIAEEKPEQPISAENGKIFNVDDKKYLYGGTDSLQHFDITNNELLDEQFHYGIGREAFPALLEPTFTTVEESDKIWADTTRFLVAYSGDEIKAYSVPDLTHHEVVNDSLNGQPIMAAYCILADLGAIYERNYGESTLTFALSGYTYYDEKVWGGLDGFIFWDRETESLWWPLIGRAVSGPLKGVKLLEMDKSNWEDTDWKTVKEKYPTAKVMISGLDFERPKTWEKLENTETLVTAFSN